MTILPVMAPVAVTPGIMSSITIPVMVIPAIPRVLLAAVIPPPIVLTSAQDQCGQEEDAQRCSLHLLFLSLMETVLLSLCHSTGSHEIIAQTGIPTMTPSKTSLPSTTP